MQKSIGSTSASAYETILAKGFKFSYFTIFSEAKIKAIPASFILDALPADQTEAISIVRKMMQAEPAAWARHDAVDASQDFRFIKIDDFTQALYTHPSP